MQLNGIQLCKKLPEKKFAYSDILWRIPKDVFPETYNVSMF